MLVVLLSSRWIPSVIAVVLLSVYLFWFLIKYRGQEHKDFSHKHLGYIMVEDVDRGFFNQGEVQRSLAQPFPRQDSLVFFQGRNQTAILIEQTEHDTLGFFICQQSGGSVRESKVLERHGEVADQILAPSQ